MKETELKSQDQVEIVKQVQQKKHKKFLGKLVPGDGHKLWELQHSDQTVRMVIIEKTKYIKYDAVEKPKLKPGQIYIPHDTNHKKFTIREGCTYLYALNEKGAMKKFCKMYPQYKMFKVIHD